MSKSKFQTYTSEFRESAVKLAIESDRPISHTARELGMNVNTLHTWMGKYSQPSKAAVSRNDDHLHDELKRLKKENARLKEERDIIKKAALYFANDLR
ncbi:MAG: transposase [Gammaproteobacteria bacterium]|nr:transposase [Gammaproteobacteria bacterium]NKB63525.1 transposase [Gammaproteobacteria bacterium]